MVRYIFAQYPASSLPGIKKLISNDPATVILWEDGTKTVAKCQDGDEFDFEKGVLICSLKKLIGNKATNEFLKEIEKQPVYHDGYKKISCLSIRICQTCKYLEMADQVEPCFPCLKEFWRSGSHPNWKPREETKWDTY